MKKVLITSTIVLGILVIVLASVLVGMFIPKPISQQPIAGPQGPQAQQQGQPGQQAKQQIPNKKPSQYKIGISYKEAMKSKKPFVVLFYADWCPHCMAFMPNFESLSKRYASKYNFVMLDAEAKKNADIVKDYAIGGYPTVFIADPVTGGRNLLNNTIYLDLDRMGGELDRYLNARK